MGSIGRTILRVLASNGLATVLLILLFLLTLFGTLEQTDKGLYEVQKKYFDSMFFLISDDLPIPFPGVYLLLMLLSVNLIVGGVYRVKWRLSKIGILIAHLGIAFLLVSGFFTMKLAQHGQVTLYEGETAGEFVSHYDWEVAVYRAPQPGRAEITEFLIAPADLEEMGRESFKGKTKTFTSEDLPFSLSFSNYLMNSWPQTVGPQAATVPNQVDGIYLEDRPLDQTAEANVRGVNLKVVEKNSKRETETILWGRQRHPFTIEVDGVRWAIDLRKVHKVMPFAVRLNEFIHERHPRTNMPKVFMSKVTKIENGVEQGVKISMNEPLRHKGYTLYQSSWGPQDAGPNQKLFSVFAVVRNPADQLPMWATFVISIGILWQALFRLFRYLKAEIREEIMNRYRGVTTTLVAVLLFTFALPAFAADEPTKERTWDEEIVQIASTIPVQDGGRVKPLSTFARFRLIAMCGKSALSDPVYGKMKPMPWLLNVLFFPEEARNYKQFVVQSSEVLDGIGLSDIVKKKRDSYSFNELEPGFNKLFELAREYSKIEPKNRSTVESQILNLALNVNEFSRLTNALEFTRHHPALNGSPALAALFPRPEDQRFSVLLARADEVRELTMSLQQPGPGRPEEERQAELAAIDRVLRATERALAMSDSLAILPPTASREENTEWMAPGELYRRAFTAGSSVAPQIALLGGLEELTQFRDDQGAFKERLAALQSGIRGLAEKRGEYEKVELEVSYYRAGYFTWSQILFIIGFVFVALCWLLPRSRWVGFAAATPLVVGLGFLTVGITVRCIIRGRPPVSTLYETILFITAVAVLSGLLIELLTRRRIALGMAAIIGVAGMFLANRYEIKQAVDTMPSLVAVLDTNFWLATHVTTISIGYSAGLLAAAIAHVYIFGKLFGLGKNDPGFYKSIARMVYGTVIFCLFFSVLGTLLGGVWANESWGRFWGWDPKENGALLICLWMLAIVHANLGKYIRDLGLAIAAVFGGIVVAFSWWGVNLLGVGLHSYGFTQGVMLSLASFIGLELLVMALGGVVWLMGRAAAEAAGGK